MKNWLYVLSIDILNITLNLYKIMIPIIISVKILEELGGIKYIAYALSPLMQFVGLPDSMGLVWATTLITNIYGGMIVFISIAAQEPLTIAQVTVLSGMMLLAHNLPVEVRIAQKTGVRVGFNLLLRIGGALLFGFLLHSIYNAGGWLQETNVLLWKPAIIADNSLSAWIWLQLQTLLQVFIIIAILVTFLKLLKSTGFERILIFLLNPILRLLGLGEKTASITIIGMNLGLTYGGGLLIAEAKKGELSQREIFGAISLIAICHALIEDTLLVMLLGADISGALYLRLVFAFIVIGIGIRLILKLNDALFYRYLGIKSPKN
ncbi:MAG: hypothetical protein KAH03_03475 [Cocleimonas sp.]|nr:hypothetical protein [Cocleimonas sp.]